MAKLYPITLFYNTLYDKGNIPDSPARLVDYESRTFSPVFLRQDYGTATVRIDATWDQIRDADYARLESAEGDTYWVLTDPPKMLSDHTAELSLMLDPLTTIGGIDKLTVLGGWASRAHVTEDPLFGNILPEPWVPSGRMIIRARGTIHKPDPTDEVVKIAVTTVDLVALRDYKADVYQAATEASESLSVVVPHVPQVSDFGGSTVGLENPDGQPYKYQLPGCYMWVLPVSGGADFFLDPINSLGLRSALLALYTIPGGDFTPEYLDRGGVYEDALLDTITGKRKSEIITAPYKYANVKNAKAVALYNSYILTSIASGSKMVYDAHELYMDGQTSPEWVIQSDPSPSGTVYIGPKYYEGAETKRFEQCVAGLPWLTAGYTYTEGAGGDIGMLNALRANRREEYNTNYTQSRAAMDYGASQVQRGISALGQILGIGVGAAGVATGSVFGAGGLTTTYNAGGIIGNLQGLAQNAAGAAYDAMNYESTRQNTETMAQWDMGDRLFDAQAAVNISAPELAFPVAANAAAYFGQAAELLQVTLGDNDRQRFDDFLSAYGYKVDAKFIKSQLSNRVNHNYIQTSGAHVTAENQPRWLLNLIGQMFDAGVRIWHVKPSQSSLTDNPIRG